MKSNLILFTYVLCALLLEVICIKHSPEYDFLDEEIIHLIDNDTALPTPDDENIYYIPIIHTNDIHGSFYPKKVLLPSEDIYSIGGQEYFGKYLTIMSKEWGDRLLFFDSGDQFQGGIEGYISQGQIMLDFYKELKLNSAVIGNHEFDYGIDFLKEYMNKSDFDWVVDNIRNRTSGQYLVFPNQKKTKMVEIEGYKIGIIGLTTVDTPTSTNIPLTDLEFKNYYKIINEESNELKNQGANAIIVLGHIGLKCKDPFKLEYKIRNKTDPEGTCRVRDEAYQLLNSLDKGVIDLFLGGHKHDVVHQWINDIPFASNDRNGKYAQIIYLPFDKKTKQLLNDKILIEGPLPICGKLFKNKNLCDLTVLTEKDEEEYGKLLNFTFHDELIEKEESITKIGDTYLPDFNKYDEDILTKTYDHLESSKDHENALGNLYSDFLRHVSGANISVINPGSFRQALYRGNISNATIYSFDPFGNAIVKFEAKGWEVKKMFRQIQQGSEGFYSASGLKMVVKGDPNRKLLSLKLYDGYKETEIKEDETYTLVSNDFCFPLDPTKKGGDDFKKVYNWFRPRNITAVETGGYNNTRDIFMEYLRNIKTLEAKKYYNEIDQRMRKSRENDTSI